MIRSLVVVEVTGLLQTGGRSRGSGTLSTVIGRGRLDAGRAAPLRRSVVLGGRRLRRLVVEATCGRTICKNTDSGGVDVKDAETDFQVFC